MGVTEMVEEIWKDLKYLTKDNKVIDFNGVYQVSNYGNIRSYRGNNGSRCSGRMRDIPIINIMCNDYRTDINEETSLRIT